MKNILWAFRYLHEKRYRAALGMFLIGISMAFELMQTILPRYIVDELVYAKELRSMILILALLLSMHIGAGLLFFFTGKIFHEIFYFWRSRVINDLFQKMQEIKLDRFDGEKIGKLTLLIGDIEGIGEELYWIPFKAFGIIKILIIAIWICYKSLYIFLMLLAVSLLSWTISKHFLNKIKKNQSDLIDERYAVHEKIDDAINGTREIISYDAYDYFADIIKKGFDKYLTCFNLICNEQGALEIITGLLKWGGILGTILLLWKMLNYNLITIGTFYVLYQFSNQFLESFRQNLDNIVGFIKTGIKLEKLKNAMSEYEMVDRFSGIELTEPIKYIEFEDAICGYKERGFQYNCSEEIVIGKKNAIIGKSGSGKSTLAEILVKNQDLLNGKCLINRKFGLDEIKHYSWMSKVAIVFQDSYIFNVTIRDNISMGKKISDDAVWDVCKIVCIDDYIHKLPNGLDEEISDRGMNMSGGQRQRIALARALVRQSELLILDEATSSMDEELQNKVQNNIDRLYANRTIVVITHRLSVVENVEHYIDVNKMREGEIQYV